MWPDDKRQEFRMTTEFTVFIELFSEEDSEPTIVISHSLDISTNGLRVIVERELPVGSILSTCIQEGTSHQRFFLMTDVKWVKPWQNTAEYLMGLALLESVSTDIHAWKKFVATFYMDGQ